MSNELWYRGFTQKSKWADSFAQDVDKLRAVVAAKTVSINLLLAMDLSKSLSKVETSLKKVQGKGHSGLLTKGAENREALNSMERRISNMERSVKQGPQD